MNKTLIITSKTDIHADKIIDVANSKGLCNIVRFNTEDFLTNCDYCYTPNSFELHFRDSDLKINSFEIKNVWFRRPEKQVLKNEDEGLNEFILNQTNAFLRGLYFFTHSTAKWYNPLTSLHNSRFKLEQLRLAKSVGLKVPNTIITNNISEASDFFKQNSGEVISKSLDEPTYSLKGKMRALFTKKIKLETLLLNPNSLNFCPTLLQEFIKKKFDVRVVVFNKKVFAFKIHSQENNLSKIDFRGISPDNLKHTFIDLPKEIESKILKYTEIQNLNFSSMDLLIDENDSFIFIENNPNGQWLWLEYMSDVKLSEIFLNELNNQ